MKLDTFTVQLLSAAYMVGNTCSFQYEKYTDFALSNARKEWDTLLTAYELAKEHFDGTYFDVMFVVKTTFFTDRETAVVFRNAYMQLFER